MQRALRWILWLWIAGVTAAALLAAPLAQGFAGRAGDAPESSRIVYFHVPLAVTSFIAFLAAAVWSTMYLVKRRPRHDDAAHAAVEVGLVFCVLATVTGAVWAEVQWGTFWNWDPRQTSIALAILFYGGYLSLRGAVEDPDTRARLAGAYAVLGFVVAPFLFFIMPRTVGTSLHPEPGGARMAPTILWIVLTGMAGQTALFFWVQSIRRRILTLRRVGAVD